MDGARQVLCREASPHIEGPHVEVTCSWQVHRSMQHENGNRESEGSHNAVNFNDESEDWQVREWCVLVFINKLNRLTDICNGFCSRCGAGHEHEGVKLNKRQRFVEGQHVLEGLPLL